MHGAFCRRLGFIRKHSNETEISIRQKNGQLFEYFVVLDFESTCWKDSKFRTQEIIEFPAVLMNARTGAIEDEFHRYLLPQENPILSDFCKELTGIAQEQVDGGIPLSLCLSQFSRWTDKLKTERNVSFDADAKHRVAFITWSDWDLSVCLQYECRRKQLRKPLILNSWIDLRASYRRFYSRRPNGLNGALLDVGLQFEGREHSGLEDARNTARLAHKMMCDGCILAITKNLNNAPVSIGPSHTVGLQRPAGSGLQSTSNAHQSTVSHQQLSIPNQTSTITDGQPVVVGTSEAKKHHLSLRPSAADCSCTTNGGLAQSTCVCHKKSKRDSGSVAAEKMSSHDQSTVIVTSHVNRQIDTTNQSRSVFNDISNNTANVSHSFINGRLSVSSLDKTWNKMLGCVAGGPENVASGMKKTPPLCQCGRRAHRKVVQTAGQNQGRAFFCCPKGRCSSGNSSLTGCKFFLWESHHELATANCSTNATFTVNNSTSFVLSHNVTHC